MAKKRLSGSKKNKGNVGKQTLTRLKNIFYAACFAVVVLACVLYTYETISPYLEKYSSEKKESETVQKPKIEEKQQSKQENEPKKTVKRQAKKPKTSSVTVPDNAELPACQSEVTQQIIEHKGYTLSYNSDYRIANWVAYKLTKEEVMSNKAERDNKFVIDPQVEGATAENEDYTRTGYDRGHLVPAADMKWSLQAMRESFYLSNITPQKPKFNRGIWKDLEEQCRLWAKENDFLLISAGPVITNDLKRLGKNRVAIPKQFYKVICTIQNGKYEAVGFLFDNRDYGSVPLKSMMIPVDSVEKVTNIDFFRALPDDLEKEAEAKVNKSAWAF